MIKYFTFLLVLFFNFSLVIAQEEKPIGKDSTKVKGLLVSSPYGGNLLPQFSPLSPNAASIQKFGDYQVNLATGIPDISIPIFEVSSGSLKMPIVLRYHASGFKVHEHASWVGLGWSLDLGASLNRSMQGLPDDISSGYMNNTITSSRDFCDNYSDYEYGNLVSSNNLDAQPDIFSYGLPHRNGKFILGYSGTDILKIPNWPININYVTKPNYIERFTLQDELGTEFAFGQRENQETVISGMSRNYTSSWLMTAVRSANTADSIIYTYQDGGNILQQQNFWTTSFIYDTTPTSGSYYSNTTLSVPTQTSFTSTNQQQNPNKIFFANGEIEFIQSDSGSREDQHQSRYLEQINIYNYENSIKTLIKVVKFNYEYFTYGITIARLKLNSVTFTDAIESTSETYGFEYWTDTIAWDTNPGLTALDYFGFFNNATANQHLISIGSYNGVAVNGGAANRETVPEFMKNAVLKKITYPTKGYTEFDYETNKFKFSGSEKYAGGLRIKSIKNTTGNKTILKRYEYASSDGAGLGLITTSWDPADPSIPLEQDLDYTPNPAGSVPPYLSTAKMATFTQDGSSTNLYSMDAALVYYTTVTEYFEDSSDLLKNGRNDYTFDFFRDIIISNIQYATRDVRPWLRGNLLSKAVYDNDNIMVATDSIYYTEMAVSSRMAAGFVTNPWRFDDVTGLNIPCSTTFQPDKPSLKYQTIFYQTGVKLPSIKHAIIDGVSSKETTFYLPNLLTDKRETIGSKVNEKITEQYTYPFSAAYISDANAQEMVNRNMLNYKLETEVSHTLGATVTPVYKQKQTYSGFTGFNARGFSKNILPMILSDAPDGTTMQDRVTFNSYNATGRPLEYYLHGPLTSVALVWGYQNTLLIAEMTNVNKAQADAAMTSADIDPEEISIPEFGVLETAKVHTLQSSLPNGQVSWYTHRSHVGISGKISPDGLRIGYSYDGLLRLKTVKDNSGKLTDVYRYNYATISPIEP